MTKPLSIKLRIKDEGDNLFVRLSERTVQEFLSSDDDPAVSFLPLVIAVDGDISIYASWNGGICDHDDSIEIPSDLLKGVTPFPTMVQVTKLPLILPCLKVHVEPLSAKDWELLQCDSEFLQQGGFLRQISVVYTKQCLRLKMENNDWVELLVNKIESSSETDETIKYGLLRQDTEVIVAPQKRDANGIVDWSPPQKLLPSQNDWDGPMLQLHKTMEVEPPLTVAPGCVLVNEAMWNSNYSWALLETSSTKEEGKRRLVQVICHKSVPQGNAGKLVGVQ